MATRVSVMAPFTRFWLWTILVKSLFLAWAFIYHNGELTQVDRYRLANWATGGISLAPAAWFLFVAAGAGVSLWKQYHGLIVATLIAHMVSLFLPAIALIEKSMRDNVGGWEIAVWMAGSIAASGYVLARGG